jgi:serine protease Do
MLSSVLTKSHCAASRMAAVLLATCSFASGAESDVRRDATVMAVEKVIPSVVNIATETVLEQHDWYEELFRRFYGMPSRQQRSLSLGSGVIIDEEGYVLTNFHVVRRASRIQVKLWNGREYEAEPVVATTSSDVALLKIKAKDGERFTAIKFAADDDLLLGETVLAVGNPFGLGVSVTKGILSSKNRRPSSGNEPLNVEDWLQTDAAINPGNSGGPLVDLRGELIGINVAVYREQDGQRGMGVGFSIPVRQVTAALPKFFIPEITQALWFGAQFRKSGGEFLVDSVQPGSPAEKAGLRERDQLLKINNKPVASIVALNRLLTEDPSRSARLLVSRDSDEITLPLRLVPFADLIQRKLGLSVLETASASAERLGIQGAEGLYVDQVEKDGPADRAKIPRGAILANVDGQGLTDFRTLGTVLTGKKKGEPVVVGLILTRRSGSMVQLRQVTAEIRVR